MTPIPVLLLLLVLFSAPSTVAQQEATGWRADHHMHLASPDLCRRVGECLATNFPAAVYASDAVRALDEAGVAKGVVLSCAYLYGLPSLHLSSEEVARLTRLENEFTATEVAKYPTRLVGFLSVDPLQPSALAELAHWRGNPVFRGLKIHLTASGVDLKRPEHRTLVARVLAAAAAQHLPVVVHVGGGDVGPVEAELFIKEVLPSAAGTWVQVAHAAGGLPVVGDNHIAILHVFAEHIRQRDPATERILFDLSFVPGPGEDSSAIRQLRETIRGIGIKRFLFGSDFNVESPTTAFIRLRVLGLTAAEQGEVQTACAPWAC